MSFVTTSFADRPKKTSAPFIASASVLNLVSVAWADLNWSTFSLPLYITPNLSHIITFSFFTPESLNKFAQAIAEAPAPLTTILTSLIFFLKISKALINAAVVIIAVPCWSSWKTGISNNSLSFCSMMKQSGAAISSKLIPPKVLPIFFIVLIIWLTSELSISISIESMSANLLNKTDLPSITGFDASAPRFPSPRIAEPLLITATKFPLLV